jgi:hypothetical protein
MGLVVDSFEPVHCHMRIELGRREALVAEKLLHGPQVRAPVEKVRCERMAENVRTLFLDVGNCAM